MSRPPVVSWKSRICPFGDRPKVPHRYRRRSSGAADAGAAESGPAAGSMTLEDFVDLCAEYGLSGTEPTSYYIPDPLPDKYLQRLRRRAFLAGLSVSGTATGNTFTHPAGPERDREIADTKLRINRAADMGAPTIRICPGDVPRKPRRHRDAGGAARLDCQGDRFRMVRRLSAGRLPEHLTDRHLILLRIGGEVTVSREIEVLHQLVQRTAGLLPG